MPDLPEIPAEVLVTPAVAPLDDALARRDPDLPDVTIATVPDATWAVARIAEAQAVIDEAHTMAAGWRQSINAHEASITDWPRRVVDTLRPLVEAFAVSQREASPRDRKGEPTVKTVRLPNGEVRTRGSEVGQTAVHDEDALVSWLYRNMPDAVKVVQTPIVATVRANTRAVFEDGAVYGKLVTDDGEVVPGIVVERGKVTATVVPQ